MTKTLVFSLTSAVIGSAFQFGYNTGVINAPADVIRSFINESHYSHYDINLSDSTVESIWVFIFFIKNIFIHIFDFILWQAFTVAVFAVGGVIGGISNGFFADLFGRKKSLLLNNIFGIVGAGFMGLAKSCNSYEMLIVGRFVSFKIKIF